MSYKETVEKLNLTQCFVNENEKEHKVICTNATFTEISEILPDIETWEKKDIQNIELDNVCRQTLYQDDKSEIKIGFLTVVNNDSCVIPPKPQIENMNFVVHTQEL